MKNDIENHDEAVAERLSVRVARGARTGGQTLGENPLCTQSCNSIISIN